MSDQEYATIDGMEVHKKDFGYAPGDEPSEWKFPLHDAAHVRDAMARFNQSRDIPPEAMRALSRKIVERAHKYGIDTGNFEKEYSSEKPVSGVRCQVSGNLAVLLTNEGTAVETPSDVMLHRHEMRLREIAVAVPGSWVKGDRTFSITKQDLADMARNFEKRKNDMIVIDYEHASEQPEVAKGGPVPGAGWIHKVAVGNQRSAASELKADSCVLTALVEWTPQAEKMLRTGQYRFFSPAIDWGARDKGTGEPQGATLTSGALTNHPFLEELPPIMLSDGTLIGGRQDPGLAVSESGMMARCPGHAPLSADPKKEILQSKGATTMENKIPASAEGRLPEKKEGNGNGSDDELLAESDGKGRHDLPILRIRKGQAGTNHECDHILSDGATDVGCISEETLAAHAKKHLGVNPDEDSDERRDMREEKASELERRSLILTEVSRDGKLDGRKAIELADRGKITFADYIRATEAEKTIDVAVREGKILPRDRKFFFRDALERPAEFTEYLNGARAVQLGSQGFGTGERLSVDEEVSLGVKKLMADQKLDYTTAYRQFLSENPVLAGQYRANHSICVNADGTRN